MTPHSPHDPERPLWELQTINDVADGIAHSLDLSDVVRGALERLCRALGVPNAAIRLRDETTGVFELVGLIGEPAVRRVWTANGGCVPRPSDAVIATGQSVVMDDIATLVSEDLAAALPVRSAVSVPMILRDELIGTLTLTHDAPRRFSQADQRLLATIASQIGGAIQSARLHAVVSRAKREWEQTFDAIADPIGVYDAQGRLLRGNSALASMLGCSVRDFRRWTCGDVGFCGGGCPRCAVGVAADGAPRRDEVTRPDGQIFSVTTFPMAPGTNGAVVQVAKNVTQEIANARRMQALSEELSAANRRSMAALVQVKNTQAQLLQAEKLSAIGQLVAGVAHELNNPLTSVIGYAQLLHDEVREQPAGESLNRESVAQDLQRIAEESERAAKIVRNLLAFARQQSAARGLVDPADLCERTLALREYALRSSGVEVVKEFPHDMPALIADGHQLQQALLNLILNAEHALRGRPSPVLRVGVRYVKEARAIEMFVGDTGHGMDEVTLGRIFDPFFTTREVGEGTGLGLSICYGIVRDHGGHIAVQSHPNEGTTFSLLLPARGANERPEEAILVAHRPGSDHEMLARALEGWGHRVTLAGSSSGALDQYLTGKFQRVFVEAAVVADDLDAWRAARAADATRTPLVLMGLAESGAVERFACEEAGAVLVPPYQLRALTGALRAVTQECV
jgi:two-component system NtrC family sensor kinase